MVATLTIDASALSGRFNSKTYFSNFFAGLTSSDGLFYGGTPDMAFGGTYYMNGSQHVRTYTDGTDPVSSAVMLEGADLAYDFIHYGAHMGHGISGMVETATFGEWIDGTTTGTQGTGAAGEVSGFGAGVVVDGLDLTAAAGAGNDASTNAVYAFYEAVQDMDATALQSVFAEYAVEMTGSAKVDRLYGYGNDDVLIGRAGDDVLVGKAGDDLLLGGRGDDALRGGSGHDLLIGGLGDDALSGGSGHDTLRGGSGADTLTGGRGDDMLTGGADADTFVIVANAGTDTITDFDGTEDLIDVSALGLTALADFTATEVGTTTVLSSGSVEIQLSGVALADLSDSDFIF